MNYFNECYTECVTWLWLRCWDCLSGQLIPIWLQLMAFFVLFIIPFKSFFFFFNNLELEMIQTNTSNKTWWLYSLGLHDITWWLSVPRVKKHRLAGLLCNGAFCCVCLWVCVQCGGTTSEADVWMKAVSSVSSFFDEAECVWSGIHFHVSHLFPLFFSSQVITHVSMASVIIVGRASQRVQKERWWRDP